MLKTLKKTKEYLEEKNKSYGECEHKGLYESEIMYLTVCLDCVESKLREIFCGDDDF